MTRDADTRLRYFGLTSFAVLVVAYFFVYFQRISVGIVGSDIVDDVGGSIGLLSSVYFWTYTLMQIPSGLMADRFGPRAASCTFLALAAAGSLLTFVGQDFTAMVVGKIMIAAGMAVIYVPLMRIVAVWFPMGSFAFMNAVVIAIGNVGAIVAAGPLGVLADTVG
ncbi:MAG: MFS transporter, partial [Candidatus Methanomethylophilaceae archaeon]|nr:MFS transporter [Candidatus Methanomethylophilaceae archaeon]